MTLDFLHVSGNEEKYVEHGSSTSFGLHHIGSRNAHELVTNLHIPRGISTFPPSVGILIMQDVLTPGNQPL
ncbi:hypothetical protein E3N88_34972 [Mikania micrantha]|uniref:Uncharacterized protein n=1 Tax=Mikania micrantha TaxID=192012 RepID=A0A5N6M018_9ASTR|nr:hypothetical protein E3N88_34972 [Mikania micrantha]